MHERAGDTQEGSIEVALARLRWAGISAETVSQTLAHSYLSPVLTAHPTEVQRKSILDAERDIAHLLTERDEIKARALPQATRWRRANWRPTRRRCAPACMQLWQTRLLRFTKLTVADEIENALSYYEATFLREIPKLYADLERSWASIRWRASCAWASGSAATATAIPTSARRRWNTRCAGSARWRCATT